MLPLFSNLNFVEKIGKIQNMIRMLATRVIRISNLVNYSWVHDLLCRVPKYLGTATSKTQSSILTMQSSKLPQ